MTSDIIVDCGRGLCVIGPYNVVCVSICLIDDDGKLQADLSLDAGPKEANGGRGIKNKRNDRADVKITLDVLCHCAEVYAMQTVGPRLRVGKNAWVKKTNEGMLGM
jgi:hypothetical protein